jgi:glutamate/tyrosine decarboxylase-like PLP-dependent enzyme
MNLSNAPDQSNARQNELLQSSSERESLLNQAVGEINDFYDRIDDRRVRPDVEAETIREHLSNYDFKSSRDPDRLLDDVAEHMKLWSLHTPHPRYYGLFNPAPSDVGMAADLMVAGLNPQLGAWHHSPYGVEVEAHVIRYFATQFGLSTSAYGHFTGGGSEANFSAVVVALTRQFPSFAQTGARGLAGQPAIYCSEEFHHSFVKIAHQCGLGREAVRLVPVTSQNVMDVGELKSAIDRDRSKGLAPFMVVGTGGTTNAGLVEPLSEIAAVAKAESIHFHVDAAWGGAVILSDRHKAKLAGIESADSITFDPHKLLSAPMGAGIFIVREHQWLRDAFGLQTDYVPQSPTENLDNYQHSFQFSRRFIGLKVFMTLASLGRQGAGAVIDRQLENANVLAEKLEKANFEVLNGASMGVVCFVPPKAWNFESHEQFESLAERVCQSGEAWISTTKLGGRSVIRACITNHMTNEDDLEALVNLLVENHP